MANNKKNNKKKNYVVDRMEYISLLANKTDEINMGNNNSKTGTACLNLAFPTCVCRPDAPCKKGCYARKGCQSMCVVQGAYYRNLRLYNCDSSDFFSQVRSKIKYSGLKMVRLFDSGDFPDEEFLYRVCDLCNEFPNVKFMAFTKKYELVNDYLDRHILPDNFNILFSAWDKTWNVPNPHNLGIAYVDFKDKEMNPVIPKNAFKCPGREATCSCCGMCWNKRVKAVVFDEH